MDEFVQWFNILMTATGMYVLYYVPSVIRRLKRWVYTPLYFSVYPMESLNPQLQRYYGDDTLNLGGDDVDFARQAIVKRAWLSFGIEAALIPFLFGMLIALVSDKETLLVFIIVFLLARGAEIILSMRRLPSYTVGGNILRIYLRMA